VWIQERKKDYYYRKAKEERYRSRAAYKLFQVVEKYHFIRNGDTVIDLGAAPGGWIQAARKIVGNEGFVLGVDIRFVEPFSEPNIRTIVGDIAEEETVQRILELLPRRANAVISDASPNISGIWEVDHARQIDLAHQALQIALGTLDHSGNLLAKVFQGDMLNDFIQEMKQYFEILKIVKPKASRAKSSEMYILGLKMCDTE
jgi:23S rRNA (uridine2552-2'-O)-methyltransferase